MAEIRNIHDSSSKRKRIRVRVGHILIGFIAMLLCIMFSASRMVQHDVVHHVNAVVTVQERNALRPPEKRNDKNDKRSIDKSMKIEKSNNIKKRDGDLSANSFHFIVSSDCTSYQRWETLTQLHSAQSINQCGRFTWIVSGCLEEGKGHTGKGRGGAGSDILTPASLLSEVERHFPHVTISNHTIASEMGKSASVARSQDENDNCSIIHPHVHFTPDFSDMSVYGGPFADGKKKRTFLNRKGKIMHGNFGNTYKFNNKPNGLHHWIVNFLAQDDRRDEAIVLIDPDFLFMNKFEFPGKTPPVLPGKPVAAKYGLGGQFLDFNLTRICDRAPALGSTQGSDSKACPFVSVTNKDVNHYYSAGPPYVIHIQDVLALSKRWSDLVPPTYDEYPLLYAEMFAYSMAAADFDLKHNLAKQLFTGCMTQWPHGEVEALKKSATTYASLIESGTEQTSAGNQGASSCFLHPLSPPPFLHYCSRYTFATPFAQDIEEKYRFFAKRRVDDSILDCSDTNDPFEPFISDKPEKMEGGDKNWNVLAVCAVVRSINYAKKKGCGT